LGSLFDGIGGWLDAGIRAGIKPIWASEIEPFPCAVTAHHYPDVKQVGDITKIDVDKLEPVDIICAGSPCQDLSIAGKREGLAGERSGLFRKAVDIVHRLRNRTGSPRFFIWENVPGAFSSNKGFDFKAVLEEITKTEIPMPRDNKWAEAGMVEWGGTSSLAWRTLDAQYWGVPQRRKRIFLIADFDGFTAGEILFVEQGVPRNSAESRKTREGTSTTDEGSTDKASVLKMRSGKPGGGKGPLIKEEQSLTLSTGNDQVLFQPSQKLASGKNAVGALMASAATKMWLAHQEAFSGDYHILVPKK
jgi:DNA (cytosine-5)-methyltransferase 1